MLRVLTPWWAWWCSKKQDCHWRSNTLTCMEEDFKSGWSFTIWKVANGLMHQWPNLSSNRQKHLRWSNTLNYLAWHCQTGKLKCTKAMLSWDSLVRLTVDWREKCCTHLMICQSLCKLSMMYLSWQLTCFHHMVHSLFHSCQVSKIEKKLVNQSGWKKNFQSF